MKPTLAILLAFCVMAVAQIKPPGNSQSSVIHVTNAYPSYSFNVRTNYTAIELRNAGTIHLLVNGYECGEFFCVISNRVWSPWYTNQTVLQPVPLISLTNLVNALTVSGDICRVKGHPWGEETVDYSIALTSIPPQYQASHKCGMCGITNTYFKSFK